MKHLIRIIVELGPDVFVGLVVLSLGIPLGAILTVQEKLADNLRHLRQVYAGAPHWMCGCWRCESWRGVA
jgi:hypothetical protein